MSANNAYILYLRQSTLKQQLSGLGIEGQKEAARRFLRADDRIVAEFVETESGRNCDRPQLAAAMDLCRRHGARLLIAKLDRLARSVRFIATMMESDVKFTAIDMPDADPFRLHIEAAIAEEEARKISARTKAALAAAKARGVRLGGYRGVPPSPEAGAKGNAVRSAAARTQAMSLMPTISALRAIGFYTPNAIACALNERGVTTSRGGSWQAVQVQRLLRAGGGAKDHREDSQDWSFVAGRE